MDASSTISQTAPTQAYSDHRRPFEILAALVERSDCDSMKSCSSLAEVAH